MFSAGFCLRSIDYFSSREVFLRCGGIFHPNGDFYYQGGFFFPFYQPCPWLIRATEFPRDAVCGVLGVLGLLVGSQCHPCGIQWALTWALLGRGRKAFF